MKWFIVIVVSLLFMVPLTGYAQEECEATALIEQMSLDLSFYDEAVTNMDTSDGTAMMGLYLELVYVRHGYEDRSVCPELSRLNQLMIQVASELEDIVTFRITMLATPDQAETYQNLLDSVIIPRNVLTYDAFFAEAARFVSTLSVPLPDQLSESSLDPIPLGEAYTYRDGSLRILEIIDPYPSNDWRRARSGNRVIALRMALSCESPTCQTTDVFLTRLQLTDGTILQRADMATFISGDEARFYAPLNGMEGDTIEGLVWLEVPVEATYSIATIADLTTAETVEFSLGD